MLNIRNHPLDRLSVLPPFPSLQLEAVELDIKREPVEDIEAILNLAGADYSDKQNKTGASSTGASVGDHSASNAVNVKKEKVDLGNGDGYFPSSSSSVFPERYLVKTVNQKSCDIEKETLNDILPDKRIKNSRRRKRPQKQKSLDKHSLYKRSGGYTSNAGVFSCNLCLQVFQICDRS